PFSGNNIRGERGDPGVATSVEPVVRPLALQGGRCVSDGDRRHRDQYRFYGEAGTMERADDRAREHFYAEPDVRVGAPPGIDAGVDRAIFHPRDHHRRAYPHGLLAARQEQDVPLARLGEWDTGVRAHHNSLAVQPRAGGGEIYGLADPTCDSLPRAQRL